MEDNSNSTNTDAVLQELQKINESLSDVNTSQKDLEEYIVLRDQKQDEEKQKQEEEQAAADEDQAKADEEQAAADGEKEATQAETIQQINEGVQLNNQLITVQGIYFGIVIGLLFIKIFIDSLTKR